MRLIAFALSLAACSAKSSNHTSESTAADTADTSVDPGPSPYPRDDVLTLADAQALGTHNSYHIEPASPLHDSHRYTHQPLDVQLEDQGVRSFELDLHYHVDLGLQVFHLPGGVDDQTTCLQFVDCLQTLKDWSDAHPWHLPIMVWLEPKDEDLDAAIEELLELSGRWPEVEDTILSVIPRDRIVTPDDVRRGETDLPTAILTHGWPTLGAQRGRFVFSMLDSGAHRTEYLAESSVLEGRLLFVASDSPEDPWAATFKVNDARGEAELAASLVQRGFIVTSNTDGADTTDEDAADKFAATLAAGSNFLATDYPAPVDGRSYFAEIPAGAPARCNPQRGLPEDACTADDIETNRGLPNTRTTGR